MKVILLIPIITINFLFGQEIVSTNSGKYVKLNPNKTWEFVDKANILSKTDLNFNEKGYAHFSKIISLKNGKNEMVNVDLTVSILQKYVDLIDFSKIDNMIDSTLIESKYSLKNKATFNPISLKINYLNEKGLLCWLEFTGQNDYGAIKDASKLIFFEGNDTKIKAL